MILFEEYQEIALNAPSAIVLIRIKPSTQRCLKHYRYYWWKSMVNMHENIVGLDSSIFMHPTTWKASGHIDAFNDPLIDNKDTKKRYRADVLIEDHIAKIEAKIEKDVVKAAKRFGDAFNKEDDITIAYPTQKLHVSMREHETGAHKHEMV